MNATMCSVDNAGVKRVKSHDGLSIPKSIHSQEEGVHERSSDAQRAARTRKKHDPLKSLVLSAPVLCVAQHCLSWYFPLE
jgi:hypothetical protein